MKEIKCLLKNLWQMIKNLTENNKKNKNYMQETHFNVLGPILNKVLALVKEAKTASMKSLGNKNLDIDEEDLENVKEELAKICGASTYVMEISG